jgi:excisionase family DNA binding protein
MIQVNTISTREASDILGISFPYLHNLIDDGKLTVLGRFGRNLVLDRSQVLALKKDRELEKRRRYNDRRLR